MKTPADIVHWLFTSFDSPACYSSAVNVHKEAKKYFPITLDEVENILQRIPAYTLHKPRRLRFKRQRTIPAGFMSDVQVDLADFQKVADENDGFKYMLVVFT